VNRKHLLLGLLGAIGIGSIGFAGLYYWSETPKTPHALFEKRCTTCHVLPNLSGYRRHELAPLVDFMRRHNGADRVISDQEALTITTYLENNLCGSKLRLTFSHSNLSRC